MPILPLCLLKLPVSQDVLYPVLHLGSLARGTTELHIQSSVIGSECPASSLGFTLLWAGTVSALFIIESPTFSLESDMW